MPDATRRIVIIANPTSGRGRRSNRLDAVVAALRDARREVAVLTTDRRGAARTLARGVLEDDAAGCRCIAACGGDGTIQEVASALAEFRPTEPDACPALGVIPAGRCNDLARALGLIRSPMAIAAVLARGRRVPIDLGRINGRIFCTVATMGFDAAVSRYVDRLRGPLSGTAAYLYGAVRVLLRYAAPRLVIEGDFGRIEGAFYLASTANTRTYGGAVPIAPGADPTDGWLDLCIIDDAPKRRLVPLLARVLKGRHVGARGVRLLRTRAFRITADSEHELWADGEWLTNTPAHVEVVPHAVDVLLPAQTLVQDGCDTSPSGPAAG